ncbi:DUF3574 domain-containing protein [Amycolatopsis azurea]|uniref:DUF3574 domain-containing protein n=1 Tax=Amycolatopsis azurea DSM 43854 TaxID=1238180 RepID=M2NKK8_9PSEU|nr:DUF3574 domain-containing protein [Amycolatopsis azurea]EMD22689.1 hypothetical protein C791_8193 [Amycolatopsis azurea DSM 43854]OOC06188.1 hypothetical protein B0293_11825 [Amycolatopsis azurea DSM 43854]
MSFSPTSRRTALAVFAAAALGLGGGVAASAVPSASAAPATPQAVEAAGLQASPGELWKRTELYFGTTKPGGGELTDAEFTAFTDQVVTPRFPDGFTELTGRGQWRGSDGVISREKSKVIVVVYPFGDRDANREIEEIRTAYKAAFAQESVLRTDSVEKVSF